MTKQFNSQVLVQFNREATETSPLLKGTYYESTIDYVEEEENFIITDSEESEDEAEKKPKKKEKTSKYGTLLHLLKANVGTGILAMPGAISNFGLLAGAVGIVVLGVICIYCMHLLVGCSKIVASKMRKKVRKKHLPIIARDEGSTSGKSETQKNLNNYPEKYTADIEVGESSTANESDRFEQNGGKKKIEEAGDTIKSLDYATTVELAFRLGPTKFRKMAPCMRFTVNVLLVLTQFGFCCVYFLFVAQSLHEVFVHMEIMTSFSAFDIMLLELPVMICLNFIPNLSNLTGVSKTAVILQSLGLAMMFAYFWSGETSDTIIPYIAPISKWPLYFGTAMYAFEGIGVVLPLENDMKRKRDFRGWTGILNVGMCIVVVFYITVGVSGYVKYGSDVKPSITFNLPVGCFSELIRIMFALAIFLSYPLQMYVPYSFTLPYLKKKLIRESFKEWIKVLIECCIRATFVIFTFAVASAVPMLDLVISFIGAFASSGLALILPPIIQIITIWESDIRYKKLIIGFDIFICLFGIFGLVIGSGTAVREIWNNFHSNATNTSSHSEILRFVRTTVIS